MARSRLRRRCSVKSKIELRWDIVVSDVQMAGMGGLALLRNIKQHWPNLPVLLMTAMPTSKTPSLQ
ncbi:response regulator [Vibrio chagasii]|nr:response regulator [Vibrio chagasii]